MQKQANCTKKVMKAITDTAARNSHKHTDTNRQTNCYKPAASSTLRVNVAYIYIYKRIRFNIYNWKAFKKEKTKHQPIIGKLNKNHRHTHTHTHPKRQIKIG